MINERLTVDNITMVTPPFISGDNIKEISKYIGDIIKNPKRWFKASTETHKIEKSSHFYDFTLWAIHEGKILSELEVVMPCIVKRAERNKETHFTFFFTDYFSPCATQIYLACCEHKILRDRVHFIGVIHGASFVKGDLFSKYNKRLFPLGKGLDTFLLKLYDEIWCPSMFFYNSIPKSYKGRKILLPLPFDSDKEHFIKARRKTKRDIDFVYIGRLTKDKNPKMLFNMIKKFLSLNYKVMCIVRCDKTSKAFEKLEKLNKKYDKNLLIINSTLNEEEISEKLSRCKVVISTAIQEGFGYGVLKAIACGCVPLVPNDAVYPEYIKDRKFLYDNLDDAIEKGKEIVHKYKEMRKRVKPINTILPYNSILISKGKSYINTGISRKLEAENWKILHENPISIV